MVSYKHGPPPGLGIGAGRSIGRRSEAGHCHWMVARFVCGAESCSKTIPYTVNLAEGALDRAHSAERALGRSTGRR
jgi:hypothetical protein